MNGSGTTSGGGTGTLLTVEDIVNVAVETLHIRDQKRFGVTDIRALIPEFNGDGDVVQWFERIVAVQTSYKVTDDIIMLVITSKLEGKARKWFDSRPEYVAYNLSDLKDTMIRMFKCKEDKLTLMKKFERRRWQKNEKFADYYYDKVLMGNRLGIDDSDMIGYLIDGFDDKNLQTQAKMKEFSSLSKMLEIMNEITPTERQSGPPLRRTFVPAPNASRPGPVTRGMASSSVQRRCFNCNESDHLANACSRPKRERGSCFRCGKTDHQIRDCPRQEVTRVPPNPDSTTLCIEKQKLIPAYTVNIEVTKLSLTVLGMVDTGSPISLISKDLIPDMFYLMIIMIFM